MNDVLEEIAVAMGEAVVSPSLGRAELILAFVVALAFILSAVQSLFGKGSEAGSRRARRF